MSDIYKFRDIVANANKNLTEAEVRFYGSAEEANRLADELEQYTDEMDRLLSEIESAVSHAMPSEYKYLENYTFAHFKTLIGGHGYTDRMNTSLRTLVEQLREYAETEDDDDPEWERGTTSNNRFGGRDLGDEEKL